MTATHATTLLAAATPDQLATMLRSLVVSNPEVRRYVELTLAPPIITPEAIEADPNLTAAQKAQAYDMLFEYHGEDEDGWPL